MKTLPKLGENLIEEGVIDDPRSQRQHLQQVQSEYKRLLILINQTSQRCSLMIEIELVHEKLNSIRNTLRQMSNIPMKFRNLNDVQTAIEGQRKLLEKTKQLCSAPLEEIRKQIDEFLRQSSLATKSVENNFKEVFRLYDEKFRSFENEFHRLEVKKRRSSKSLTI